MYKKIIKLIIILSFVLQTNNLLFANEKEDIKEYKWFALRVQSNNEDKVKNDLEKRIKIQGIEGFIPKISVPSEDVTEIKGGTKRVAKRKIYPGYFFAKIGVNENGRIPEKVWLIFRETPGISNFVGGNRKPIAMSNNEVEKLLNEVKHGKEKPKAKIEFHKGDKLRVKEGPFENFEGVVEEVFPDNRCLTSVLTIFGRPTLIEFEYWQLEKLD